MTMRWLPWTVMGALALIFPRVSEAGGPVSLNLDHLDRVDIASVVAEVERRLIRWAMERTGGNLTAAAEILQVPRSTLQYKLAKSEHADPYPMI